MIVKMRLKPSMLGKLPGQRVKDKKMYVGNHVVQHEWAEFEVTEENIHHIESVGTLHWCEIDGAPEKQPVVLDEEPDELDAALEGEVDE